MPFTEIPRFTAADTTIDDVMHHFRVQMLGAMVSARRVLPGMLERRRGTLLFATGLSAVQPLPLLTPVGIANTSPNKPTMVAVALYLTGVSGGSHTYKWAWYSDGSGNTATLYGGPSYGPFTMEAWAAP